MKPHQITTFVIAKGSGQNNASLVSGKFNLGYSNSTDDSFVFDKSGTFYTYQVFVEVIGLKKIPIQGGLVAKNSAC
jgi:hypothetical protein